MSVSVLIGIEGPSVNLSPTVSSAGDFCSLCFTFWDRLVSIYADDPWLFPGMSLTFPGYNEGVK